MIWRDCMDIVYAREPLPTKMVKSIFLAGPTPRKEGVKSWRESALKLLAGLGYDGHVFVPEPADGVWSSDYTKQVLWEDEAMNQADCILFWVPRDMDTLPGLTTNDEWGHWKDSGKVVFGSPPDAPHTKYQRYFADKFAVPCFDTLVDTLKAALARVKDGSLREGGEVKVPLYMWSQRGFQDWYKVQRAAGNRLDGAKVLWTFRLGPNRDKLFCWALHVSVYIASEERHKLNEFVLGRPDISAVVLWHRAANLDDTEIVLIKEFRSPGRTNAFVRELPAGSSHADQDPIDTAVEELRQEANFSIDPAHLKQHHCRQLAGTLSSFSAHVFSSEISDEELATFKSLKGQMNGVEEDGEQTYLEIYKVGTLLKNPVTDWSTLGMLFEVLSQAMR